MILLLLLLALNLCWLFLINLPTIQPTKDIENKRSPYGSTVCPNIRSGYVILAKITQIKDYGKASRSNRRRRRIKLMKFTSVFTILLLSNDINLNPGPNNMKSLTKSPRKECSKNIRSNQNAIRCAKCDTWVHVKCLPMTKVMFQYYLAHTNEEWLCDSCGLPNLATHIL